MFVAKKAAATSAPSCAPGRARFERRRHEKGGYRLPGPSPHG
ncbi:hypothetical protein NY78_3980 [Desulfovibrio sp. TomC]|nr:hypothetical protein NY78_3980 [Desulfovibrio sp. TomC]